MNMALARVTRARVNRAALAGSRQDQVDKIADVDCRGLVNVSRFTHSVAERDAVPPPAPKRPPTAWAAERMAAPPNARSWNTAAPSLRIKFSNAITRRDICDALRQRHIEVPDNDHLFDWLNAHTGQRVHVFEIMITSGLLCDGVDLGALRAEALALTQSVAGIVPTYPAETLVVARVGSSSAPPPVSPARVAAGERAERRIDEEAVRQRNEEGRGTPCTPPLG